MRVIIFSILAATSHAAVLNRAYLPPNSQTSNGAYQGAQGPFPSGTFQGPTSIPSSQGTFQNGNFKSSPDGNAAILKFANDVSADGFQYSFETANGIKAEESGQADNGARTRGSFSYLGADGLMYTVVFSADENGFQPQGAHLPIAPPIPEEIQKSLEQNARDEANGIFDDGSYSEARYGEKNPSGFQSSFKSSSGFSSGAGFQANAGSPGSGGFQGFAPQQTSSGFQSAGGFKSSSGFSSGGGFSPNSGFPGSGNIFQGFATQQKFSPQTGYQY